MFKNIVFDLDSTLVTIEGIDELARMLGVYEKIATLTAGAMTGSASFEEIFVKRLEIVRPGKKHLNRLARLYCRSLTEGAVEVIDQLIKTDHRVFLLTGGLNPAVAVVAHRLGIAPPHVFANELYFDASGNYAGFNKNTPLWKNHGKRRFVSQLKKKYHGTWLAIGDGITDFEMTSEVDRFIAFTGIRKNNFSGACQIKKLGNLLYL